MMAVALARLGAPADEQDALGPLAAEVGSVSRGAGGARGGPRRAAGSLAVLSNTDRDLLDASLARIGVEFDQTVVASEIGSYKPAPAHWDEFFARTGADREHHVHVGREPVPRHRPRFRARPADDLDQPARRGGRAAARRRAAEPGRARRQPRLAGAREHPARDERGRGGVRRAVRLGRGGRCSAVLPGSTSRPSTAGGGRSPRDEHLAVRGGRDARRRCVCGDFRVARESRRGGSSLRAGARARHAAARARGGAAREQGAERVHSVHARRRTSRRRAARAARLSRGAPLLGDGRSTSRRIPPESDACDRDVPRGGRARFPRRARGGVRGPLGAASRVVRGLVGAPAGANELRPVALVRHPRRRRDRGDRAQRDARAGGGYVGRSACAEPGADAATGERSCSTASASSAGAAQRGSTLGVDASNATGATQLYESVGMRVEMEEIVWEKALA